MHVPSKDHMAVGMRILSYLKGAPFMHVPSEDHMPIVMGILSYLKGASGRGLNFKKYGYMEVKGYADTDWTGNIIDGRSTSGYFTFVVGNLVTWQSKKQNVVVRSLAKAGRI